VRKAALDAAAQFERTGYVVDEITLPLDTDDRAIRETIEKALFSTLIGAPLIELTEKKDRLTTYGRRFVDLAARLGPLDANEAAEATLRFYRCLEECVFDKGYDALLTPTVATSEVAADFDPTRRSIVIDGRAVDPYAGWHLTSLFNLLNWMPVVNGPAGAATMACHSRSRRVCRRSVPDCFPKWSIALSNGVNSIATETRRPQGPPDSEPTATIARAARSTAPRTKARSSASA